MLAIILGLLLAAGVVVLVALPFLREPVAADDRLDAPTEAEARRLELIEERDRALAALKELEFDHRAGTIDDEDYRTLVTPLRQAAARALRSLDAETGNRRSMSELPTEPGPPPDEGTPPTPAPVPEPYPPPDEATIPSPDE
ncbi:MAG TPA: hypothetical protein VFB25_08775 [Gaiellaceae bacterium]|nr:hypothetical protein [Gaiellaceae bacterium]